jgi:hypothetical protein
MEGQTMKKNKIKSDAQAIKGSTIVGVLIAMVVISIVAASMVKNTGSHSGVSMNYGVAMTAGSSSASGILATNQFFSTTKPNALPATGATPADSAKYKLDSAKYAADTARILKRLRVILADSTIGKDNAKRNVYDTAHNKKLRIGSANQYFLSRIARVDSVSNKVYARFDIDGAIRETGRAQKQARVFYHMDGMSFTPGVGGVFKGKSAFFLGGQMIGNDGMRVRGHATFTDPNDQMFNTSAKIEFLPDSLTGEGDVYFNGFVKFNSVPTFQTKAYFDKSVKFQNNSTPISFDSSTAIRGNLDLDMGTASFQKDFYFAGNMGSLSNTDGSYNSAPNNGAKITSIGGNLHYTDTLSVNYGCNYSSAVICYRHNKPEAWHTPTELTHDGCHFSGVGTSSGFTNVMVCAKHGLESTKHLNSTGNMPSTAQTGWVDHDDGNNLPLTREMMENALSTGTLQSRVESEPILDMSQATQSGKTFFSLAAADQGGTMSQDAKTLNGTALTTFITGLRNSDDNTYDKYFWPGDRKDENSHFLINVDGGQNYGSGGEFNEKVMLKVDGQMAVSGNFYTSSATSSTLVYVGKEGYLNQFGSNGLFRGLVYFDTSSYKQSEFSWGVDGRVEGAVLIRGNVPLKWNKNGSGTSQMTIVRDDDVLKHYAGLQTTATPTAPGDMKANGTITLKALGYYFR